MTKAFVDLSADWTKPEELGALRLWARGRLRAAEVGTWTGRSALEIGRSLGDGGTLLCVDDFCGDPDPRVRENFFGDFDRKDALEAWSTRIEPVSASVALLLMSSTMAAEVLRSEGRTFDFVFLDGCHEHSAVLADIRAWWPLVENGGVMCGHDHDEAHQGVVTAVRECFPLAGQVELGPGTLWRAYR